MSHNISFYRNNSATPASKGDPASSHSPGYLVTAMRGSAGNVVSAGANFSSVGNIMSVSATNTSRTGYQLGLGGGGYNPFNPYNNPGRSCGNYSGNNYRGNNYSSGN